MYPIARILVRKDRIAGLFIPMGNPMLLMDAGIWEVREILDEYTLTFIGKPAMPEPRLNGLSLEGLMDERSSAIMTEQELENVRPSSD